MPKNRYSSPEYRLINPITAGLARFYAVLNLFWQISANTS
jgi:hypothetical protein